jgi:hypothetical protein
MRFGYMLMALLLTVTLAAPQPYPGQVQIRGRQHFAVQGQPLRNAFRWWFGGVPIPAKPAEQAK